MIVYYRLSGVASSNPSPLYQSDKRRLNQFCLRSFVTAFRDQDIHMVFIADHCGKEYDEILKEIVPFEFDIIYTSEGINATALRQYDMAYQGKDDLILFQECDYVYRPSSGKLMVEAIKHYELVSPYDHPDFYSRYDIHDRENQIDVFNGHHYRTAKRNTMTFGMTREALERQYKILMKYGYLDNEVWSEMKNNGNQLWTPIPSFSTHMAKDFMAHGIPWEAIFKIYE